MVLEGAAQRNPCEQHGPELDKLGKKNEADGSTIAYGTPGKRFAMTFAKVDFRPDSRHMG